MLPYTLTFEQLPDYLHARVSAPEIDRETALAYLREIADTRASLGYDRFILERDIPQMLTDTDLFYTTNDFLLMMAGAKVAFLNPHLPIDADMDFAIVIAANRGAQFKLCKDLEEAEEWLSAD
jgi:hypothetical protein